MSDSKRFVYAFKRVWTEGERVHVRIGYETEAGAHARQMADWRALDALPLPFHYVPSDGGETRHVLVTFLRDHVTCERVGYEPDPAVPDGPDTTPPGDGWVHRGRVYRGRFVRECAAQSYAVPLSLAPGVSEPMDTFEVPGIEDVFAALHARTLALAHDRIAHELGAVRGILARFEAALYAPREAVVVAEATGKSSFSRVRYWFLLATPVRIELRYEAGAETVRVPIALTDLRAACVPAILAALRRAERDALDHAIAELLPETGSSAA